MKKRLYILDSLKGIAMILVLITHSTLSNRTRLLFGFPFWVVMAVPIFIFVSGFVNSVSFEKKGVSSLSAAYSRDRVINKLLRFSIPYLVIFILECVIDSSILRQNPIEVLRLLLSGGKGPGGYYYSFMIQFIFIFPIIYTVVKKNPRKGLIYCLLFNIIYELLVLAYRMNYRCYSQLLFRYTFLIAFGAFMYFNKRPVKKSYYAVGFTMGLVFLICHHYFGFKPLIFTMWSSTSCLAVLYVLPFLAFCVNKLGSLRIPPLEAIGKSSYNIFLVQMVYFEYFEKHFAALVTNRFLLMLVNIAVCLVFGFIFYRIDSKITNRICEKAEAALNTGEAC